MDEDFSVLAAHVTGAHGVGGNVRLRLVGENADATVRSLQGSKMVRLMPPEGEGAQVLTLSSLRRQGGPKGAWLAHFREIKDRTAAEGLAGWQVLIPMTARAPLPDGEYYVDQLIGLEIVTEAGRSLGRLTDVLYSPANDVYETDTGVLIPAVSEYLRGVDFPTGRILVKEVPGLGEEG